MRKFIVLFLLLLFAIGNKVFAKDTSVICLNCNEDNFIADVFVLLPDDLQGQLISGQFYKIADGKVKPEMTMEEIQLFLESNGRKYIKLCGESYFLLFKDRKYFLVEVIRNLDEIEELKIMSIYTVIDTKTPFLNIVIPRVESNNNLKAFVK